MAFTTPQGRTATSLSEINLTPLVDVMLVLLIIFMVTAPMLQTGIDVQLPETRTAANVDPQQRIVISLDKEEQLFFRAEPINVNNLGARLQREIKDPKEHIFVQ